MPVMSSMGALTYSKGLPAPYVPYIGEFIYGGYYNGIYNGQYVIVAPNAAMTSSYGNWTTANNFCDNLVYNGYSDWILPNITILTGMASTRIIFANIGQGYNTGGGSQSSYWSSTGTGVPGFHYAYYFASPSQQLSVSDASSISFRACRLVTPI